MKLSNPWYVYIIKCSDKKFYVGITQDVNKRVELHNKGLGCRFTKYRKPVKLIYKEASGTKSEARNREIEIKRYSKKKKLELINAGDPSTAKILTNRSYFLTLSQDQMCFAHLVPITRSIICQAIEKRY